jgi:hypothetical protein
MYEAGSTLTTIVAAAGYCEFYLRMDEYKVWHKVKIQCIEMTSAIGR